MKFIALTDHGTEGRPDNIENKTASFQKEDMRTQVALIFFMKCNLYSYFGFQ